MNRVPSPPAFLNKLLLWIGVLLTGAVLGGCATQIPVASTAPAGPDAPIALVMTEARQQAISAEQALQILKDGNARFVAGAMLARDLPAQVRASGRDGQFPLASIVSCIDSRADPALVFDQGIGDLFVARVAGNVVNPDVLGSLEYGSAVAGTKLIVILGHTHCGAIKGACDSVVLGNLTQLVARLQPAVAATSSRPGAERSSKNAQFVDAVAATNVELTVRELLDKSPVLQQLVQQGRLQVVGAMLDVETGVVKFD